MGGKRMERIKCIEKVEAVLRDKYGKVKKRLQGEDLITNVGWDLLCELVAKTPAPASADYIAVGTGTTAAKVADIILESEISSGGGERKKGTFEHTTGTKAWKLSAKFTFTQAFNVNETGIFNASSGGTLLCRDVFDTTFEAVATDILEILVIFQLS